MSDDPEKMAEAEKVWNLAQYLQARLRKHPLEMRLMAVGLLMVWQLSDVPEGRREETMKFLAELTKMEKI